MVSLFAGVDYLSKRGLVEYRIKGLTYACVCAVYGHRSVSRGTFCSSAPHCTANFPSFNVQVPDKFSLMVMYLMY